MCLSCRITPVALVSTAMSASNALEMLATGAPIMGCVRTVTMAMGSAVATRVSMAPHVRTVSQDDMGSTAPPVSNTHTHPDRNTAEHTKTQPEISVCQNIFQP